MGATKKRTTASSSTNQGEQLVFLTVVIPKQMKKQLRIKLTEKGLTARQFVQTAVESFLNQN